jgi:hypothetical protein
MHAHGRLHPGEDGHFQEAVERALHQAVQCVQLLAAGTTPNLAATPNRYALPGKYRRKSMQASRLLWD